MISFQPNAFLNVEKKTHFLANSSIKYHREFVYKLDFGIILPKKVGKKLERGRARPKTQTARPH